jgi:hypothetical protein
MPRAFEKLFYKEIFRSFNGSFSGWIQAAVLFLRIYTAVSETERPHVTFSVLKRL